MISEDRLNELIEYYTKQRDYEYNLCDEGFHAFDKHHMLVDLVTALNELVELREYLKKWDEQE